MSVLQKPCFLKDFDMWDWTITIGITVCCIGAGILLYIVR